MSDHKEKEPESSLNNAVRDGVFYSIMAGIGETYLNPYALFLKATNTQIGLLAAIPPLLGVLFQLPAVRILNRLRDRKRVILLGVGLQACMWLPILSLPFLFESTGITLLIAAVAAYFIFGNVATPAWNSLMGDLVPPETRGSYFARRTRIMSIGTFAALVAGGVILQVAKDLQWTALGFAAIFLIAFCARGVSAWYLSRMVDPPYPFHEKNDFSLREFLSQTRHSNFARFVLYTGVIHFSVMIAGPFFTVFMLRDLHFSYLQFMASSAVSVLFQFLILQHWGKFGDRFGNKKLLVVTGLLLPVIPWLWLASPNFYYILGIQMIAGAVWAGFSLCIGNFVFDAVPAPLRAKSVAIYHLTNAGGAFLGALLGGWMTRHLPQSFTLFGMTWTLISNLQWLFFISGLLRLGFAGIFLPMIREVRDVEPLTVRDLIFRVSQIRPFSGLRFDLFTGNRKEK